MLRIVAFLASILCVGQLLADSPKVGYVDAAKLAESSPQAAEALKKLEEEFGPRDDEIRELRARLRAAEAELDKNSPVMSQSAIGEAQIEITGMRRRLARLQQEYRDELNLRKNQELAKLQRLIIEEINKIAEAEGFDLIIEQAVYHSDEIDITDKVLEKLRQ